MLERGWEELRCFIQSMVTSKSWWICRLWVRDGGYDGWHCNDFRHSQGSISLPAAPHVHRAALAHDKTRFLLNPSEQRNAVYHPSQSIRPAVIVPSLCSLICQEEIVRPNNQQQLHLLPHVSSTHCSRSFVIYLMLSFHDVQSDDSLFNLYFTRSSQMSIITSGHFLLPDIHRIKFSSLCVSQFFILLLLIFFLEILFIMLFFIYQDEVRRMENPWCLIYPAIPFPSHSPAGETGDKWRREKKKKTLFR